MVGLQGPGEVEPTGIEPVTSCLQSPSEDGRLSIRFPPEPRNRGLEAESADLRGSNTGG